MLFENFSETPAFVSTFKKKSFPKLPKVHTCCGLSAWRDWTRVAWVSVMWARVSDPNRVPSVSAARGARFSWKPHSH